MSNREMRSFPELSGKALPDRCLCLCLYPPLHLHLYVDLYVFSPSHAPQTWKMELPLAYDSYGEVSLLCMKGLLEESMNFFMKCENYGNRRQ